eukprot:CAMPEP_0185795940 /NCGR_PEP_ID=MMETSP1174-20130828/160812_1 /TAXON_ID=35687 /ORGANISM="Dictyocha speculum, Strain CCMP1381" /LENGTH=64 /DNA_ID=CAMNT_0028491265 /DNA_START=110 /DNA_END=304 /DNA_ORIENTATION=-
MTRAASGRKKVEAAKAKEAVKQEMKIKKLAQTMAERRTLLAKNTRSSDAERNPALLRTLITTVT